MVSCASNLRCFQAIISKFYNEREKDNGYIGCKNGEKHLFPKIISAASISLLCCSTTPILLQSVVRATGNNILVYYISTYYIF